MRPTCRWERRAWVVAEQLRRFRGGSRRTTGACEDDGWREPGLLVPISQAEAQSRTIKVALIDGPDFTVLADTGRPRSALSGNCAAGRRGSMCVADCGPAGLARTRIPTDDVARTLEVTGSCCTGSGTRATPARLLYGTPRGEADQGLSATHCRLRQLTRLRQRERREPARCGLEGHWRQCGAGQWSARESAARGQASTQRQARRWGPA